MLSDNRVSLCGEVAGRVHTNTTVHGIPHWRFYLVHRSTQCEAGLDRTVRARLLTVCAGDTWHTVAASLAQGVRVRVVGFLTEHRSRTGESQIALHASELDILSQLDHTGVSNVSFKA